MDQRSGIVRQVRPNPGSQANVPGLGAGLRPLAERRAERGVRRADTNQGGSALRSWSLLLLHQIDLRGFQKLTGVWPGD
jgi:hypothetical protein